jgi:hypothetical protein
VKRRKYLALYLIAALLFLRFAGVHVHVHNHAPVDSHDSTHLVQLGSGDDHGEQHSQDVDVDVLDASFVKKPDFDGEQPLLLAALLLVLLTVTGSSRPLLVARGTPYFPGLRYRIPPATAPPA